MKVTKRRHKIIGNIKNMKNKKITRKTRSIGYINGSKGTKKMESMGYINNRKSRKRRNIRKSKKRRTIIKHRKSKKNAGGLDEQIKKLGKTIENLERKIAEATRKDEKVELEDRLQATREEYDFIEAQINAGTSAKESIFNRNKLVKQCDELLKNFKEKKELHLTPLNNMLIDYRNIEVTANEEKAELTGDATRTIIGVIKIQLADVINNVIDNLRSADARARPAHMPAAISDTDRDFFNLTATEGNHARKTPTTTRRNLEYTDFMRKIYLNGYENGTKTRLDYSNADDAKFYYDLIDRIDKEKEPDFSKDFSKLKTYLETYIPTEIPDRVRITHELKGTEGDPYHIFKFYGPGYVDDDDDLFHLTIHTSREVFEADNTDIFNGGKIHLKKSVRDSAGKYVTQYKTCTNLRPYIFTKIPGLDLIGPNRCLQFIPIYPKHSADYATLADKLKLVIVKGVNEFILKNQIDDEASRDRRVIDEKELITAKHTAAQEFFKDYITTLSDRSIIMKRRTLIHNRINDIKDKLEEFTKFITNTDELYKKSFKKCLEKVSDTGLKDILDEINAMMLRVKTLINDAEAFITTEIPTTGPKSNATIERLNKDALDNYSEFLDGDGDFLTNLETFRNNALANPEQIVGEDKLTPFNTHVDRLNEALVNLKLAATTRNTPGAETSAAAAKKPLSERKKSKLPVDPVEAARRALESIEPIGNKKGSKTNKSGQGKRLNKITRKKIK